MADEKTKATAPVVWINGFPGSGKLTIAKEMATLCSTAIIVDNHQLIDPVEATYPRTHREYNMHRKACRQEALEKYVCGSSSTPSRLVVFTDFQSTDKLGRAVAAEYKAAAQRAGRPFVPVYVTCDVGANMERVAAVDRINGGTGKLTDARVLEALRSTCELFRFDSCPGLTLGSTRVQPRELAGRILAFVDSHISQSS